MASELLGFNTVGAVEIEPYCREVLLCRQRDEMLGRFPIFDDVRKFDGKPWRGLVDVISAGFPCQPYSNAGKKKGKDDKRNLWPDTLRVVREVGPLFVFLENVPGLLHYGYFGSILGGLADSGYDVVWDVISAGSLGAPHIRERLWILAYSNEIGRGRRFARSQEEKAGRTQSEVEGHDINSQFEQWLAWRTINTGKPRALPMDVGKAWGRRIWSIESYVCRVSHGLPNRVHRLKALGNAQVPAVAAAAFILLFDRAMNNMRKMML